MSIKPALKRLRAFTPLNHLLTSAIRVALTAAGRQSELAIRHLPRVGVVRRRLPNGASLALWSRGDDWVSNQIYWRGWAGYEPETAPLFFRLAERARVTLDVGAFVGFYTVLAAHARPQGRVYAFEPLPEAYGRLRRNVALNGLVNVCCVEAAAGEADGEAEFFHAASHLPCSSSLSYEFMKSVPGLTGTRVRVLALDRFLERERVERVDLVKVDTESTEPAVLAGLQRTLRRDRPAIVCEVLRGRGAEQALERLLLPLAYRFYLLTPQGPSARTRIEGHPQWLNYLFTPLGPDEVQRLY